MGRAAQNPLYRTGLATLQEYQLHGISRFAQFLRAMLLGVKRFCIVFFYLRRLASALFRRLLSACFHVGAEFKERGAPKCGATHFGRKCCSVVDWHLLSFGDCCMQVSMFA